MSKAAQDAALQAVLGQLPAAAVAELGQGALALSKSALFRALTDATKRPQPGSCLAEMADVVGCPAVVSKMCP